MPKKPAPRRRTDPSGFTITPRGLGVALTIVGLLAALWKPVEVATKLSTSIDKLSTAVTQLQTVMKEQGEDISTLKSQSAGLAAGKAAHDSQLLSLEQRVQQLENRKQ